MNAGGFLLSFQVASQGCLTWDVQRRSSVVVVGLLVLLAEQTNEVDFHVVLVYLSTSGDQFADECQRKEREDASQSGVVGNHSGAYDHLIF